MTPITISRFPKRYDGIYVDAFFRHCYCFVPSVPSRRGKNEHVARAFRPQHHIYLRGSPPKQAYLFGSTWIRSAIRSRTQTQTQTQTRKRSGLRPPPTKSRRVVHVCPLPYPILLLFPASSYVSPLPPTGERGRKDRRRRRPVGRRLGVRRARGGALPLGHRVRSVRGAAVRRAHAQVDFLRAAGVPALFAGAGGGGGGREGQPCRPRR